MKFFVLIVLFFLSLFSPCFVYSCPADLENLLVQSFRSEAYLAVAQIDLVKSEIRLKRSSFFISKIDFNNRVLCDSSLVDMNCSDSIVLKHGHLLNSDIIKISISPLYPDYPGQVFVFERNQPAPTTGSFCRPIWSQ